MLNVREFTPEWVVVSADLDVYPPPPASREERDDAARQELQPLRPDVDVGAEYLEDADRSVPGWSA